MVSSVHHFFPGSSTTVSGRFLFSLRSRLSFLRGSITTLAPTDLASLATACFTPSCRSVTLECISSLQDIACHASTAYDPFGWPFLCRRHVMTPSHLCPIVPTPPPMTSLWWVGGTFESRSALS